LKNNEGPDRANLHIKKQAGDKDEEDPIDEIKRYYDCRYVSPCEASWRIFMFDIHEKWPAVMRLILHLEGQQCIRFKEKSKASKSRELSSIGSNYVYGLVCCKPRV